MSNADKMTNVKALAFAIENGVDFPTDVVEKLKAIKASYEKKSVNKKPTANQVENEALKDKIVEALAENGNKTATEVMDMVGLKSCAKATSLLTALSKEHRVIRTLDKKTARFSVAVDNEEVEE